MDKILKLMTSFLAINFAVKNVFHIKSTILRLNLVETGGKHEYILGVKLVIKIGMNAFRIMYFKDFS